jgi:hypothetical protein
MIIQPSLNARDARDGALARAEPASSVRPEPWRASTLRA